MKFKDLMKLSYDLSEEIKHLNNSISNIAIINDLNEMDRQRLWDIKTKATATTMKALDLNNIVLQYVLKKDNRMELKK